MPIAEAKHGQTIYMARFIDPVRFIAHHRRSDTAGMWAVTVDHPGKGRLRLQVFQEDMVRLVI